MIKSTKDYIAVSIGENICHLVHLQGSLGSQKVIGLGKESFEGDDVAMWADKIAVVIDRLGIKKAAGMCVIPSNIVTTKNIEIPSLDQEEIRSIIDLQAGRHTPYSREEILIGYISIGVFQRNYTKVLLIIANREAIINRLEACEQAGLHVEKVLFGPECTASLYADIFDVQENDDPIGIIDIGRLRTDFIVEHNRTVATCRTIPIGFQELANNAASGKEMFIKELIQSLEVYKNEDIHKLPGRYVVTVDNALSQDLLPALKERFGVDAEIVTFERKVEMGDGGGVKDQAREDSFVALVGSMALAPAAFDVDMMPEEIKNQREIQNQGQQVILTGVFLMILLVLACAFFFAKIYFRNVYYEKLKKEYIIKQYLVVQLDKVAHRTRIIKDFVRTRMVSLDVLQELYRLVPDEMYLQNVLLEENGTINIQGISESMSTVFDVVKALEDSTLFKNVKTRSTTAKKDRGKDAAAFDIVFKLESAPDDLEQEADGEQQEE